MWSKLKRWWGGRRPMPGLAPPRPDLAGQEPTWIDAAQSPFGVRVLDVRPITLGVLSTSQDPRMAANALSYGGEDGRSFASQKPALKRQVAGELRYPAPGPLANGALFVPSAMEQKWALFIQEGWFLLVRSWQRQVVLRARVAQLDGEARLGPFEGAVMGEQESEAKTLRAVDFIVRTHALGEPWPAPLPEGLDAVEPRTAALWCFSVFGQLASYAAIDPPAPKLPSRPLRTL